MKLLLKFLVVLAALLLVGASVGAQKPSTPLTGNWTGSLNVSGMPLRIVVHFMPKPDGTLTATFDSPDQNALGLTFSAATVTGQMVHLDAPNISASYEGTLNAPKKTITGRWTQNGNSLPLTLTKTDHVTALDRPQEPHPPFPYTSADVTFPGGAAGVTLAGTLTTPPGTGPFPAAVLISGSGPNRRDEPILGHKPFLLLADTLTRRGVAVLRYDKRGIGQSTGSYARATSADFAADAEAAVRFLQTQTVIDPKRIGLIGHSEGGLIAPLVASEHPDDIAFAVLLAGPAMNGEKILLAQAALIAKADGVSSADIKRNAAASKTLFDLAAQQPPAVVQVKAQKIILAALTPKEKKELGNPVKFAKMQTQTILLPWFRYFLVYNPLPALQKTRCPVLALDGSKDLQVPPAEDLALIGQALKSGGNKNVTIKELPDLNHLFQTCVTGSPSEYAKISETMAPIALTTISDWVASQTGIK